MSSFNNVQIYNFLLKQNYPNLLINVCYSNLFTLYISINFLNHQDILHFQNLVLTCMNKHVNSIKDYLKFNFIINEFEKFPDNITQRQ